MCARARMSVPCVCRVQLHVWLANPGVEGREDAEGEVSGCTVADAMGAPDPPCKWARGELNNAEHTGDGVRAPVRAPAYVRICVRLRVWVANPGVEDREDTGGEVSG